MNDEQWQRVHEETGTDILTIVMDLVRGRVRAGDTMDRILVHCMACYRAGMEAGAGERARGGVDDKEE